jgi:hypothetical protein
MKKLSSAIYQASALKKELDNTCITRGRILKMDKFVLLPTDYTSLNGM